jgi:hypothetical protein
MHTQRHLTKEFTLDEAPANVEQIHEPTVIDTVLEPQRLGEEAGQAGNHERRQVMKTRRRARVPGMALPVMLTLLVLQVLVCGQYASARENTLVGTWLLELTVRDCQTGEPIGTTTNQALHTYLPGGSLVGSTNVTALRSPSYGIWKHTDKRHFLATFMNFSFNADGTPAGRAEVTERIDLGEDPHTFTATSLVEIFVNDNVVATICVGETAQRFAFDQ